MSAHVLLNLLNELRKRDKMCGLQVNKFNNTGAQMLDSIYNRILKLLKNYCCFWRENIKILPFLCNIIMNIIT